MGGDGRWTAELVSRACALSGALLAATLPIWTIKIDGRMRCDSRRRKEERRRKNLTTARRKNTAGNERRTWPVAFPSRPTTDTRGRAEAIVMLELWIRVALLEENICEEL